MIKISASLLLLTLLSCNANVVTKSGKSAEAFSTKSKSVTVYTTALNTNLRLTPTDTLQFNHMGQPLETQTCVFVDPGKTFQTFLGIGGALTDAAAETFYKMPKDKQKELMNAYFNKESGIGYTLGRTNINSCDFSSDTYTYVEDGDSALKTFDIAHDRKYKIPFIKQAIEAAGGKLILYATPWSPPAFMKTNNDMLLGGKLKTDYYQSWANYYTKFISEYEKDGIPIWGITIQNEPMAKQKWESCIYTGEEERDFLKNNLGPTMEKAGYGDKKIIGWDHNRDLIYQRASTLLNDSEAAKYLWGIGFHWYESWSGGSEMFSNVALVHEAFPETHLIFTEGCKEKFDLDKINDWALGEKYGTSMINDFNAGTVAWTDWNILLDETGGPNHVQNFCFAPIHGNTKTGELLYTNEYFYIGHFSKFIKEGAKRITSSPSRSNLLSTSFINPDGKVVTIVMNKTDEPVKYFLWIAGEAAEVQALPRSIQTLVF